MGTKMTVDFANICMGKVESQILDQSAQKPLAWKRYLDDIFSIWNINKGEATQFIIEQANIAIIPLSNSRKQRSSTQKFTTPAEITFEDRKPALQQKCKQHTRILPFVTQ